MRATWPDTERIVTMTTGLIRFTQRARAEPKCRFNALMGLLYDPEGLHASFERQAGNKAPGVDGIRKENNLYPAPSRKTQAGSRVV